MATYQGPIVPPTGIGIAKRPVCFTGKTGKWAVFGICGAGLGLGALIGLGAGLIVAMITGPELISKFVAAAFGAVIGAIIGLYITASAISGGICTCPPGRFGFCINIVFFRLLFGRIVPAPPFVESAPAQCPILVPPGCP